MSLGNDLKIAIMLTLLRMLTSNSGAVGVIGCSHLGCFVNSNFHVSSEFGATPEETNA